MRIKPLIEKDGIIIYWAQNNKGIGHFIALILNSQHLKLIIDVGFGVMKLNLNKTLNINTWYQISVMENNSAVSMILDSRFSAKEILPKKLVTQRLETLFYVGGVDNEKVTLNQNVETYTSFRGCVDKVS